MIGQGKTTVSRHVARRRPVVGAITCLAVLVVVSVAAGCGRLDRDVDQPPGTAGTHTIDVAGRERSYLVRRPAATAPPTGYPVVVVLHGGGGSGEQVEEQSGMTRAADAAGFVAVYPDGSGRFDDRLLTWNAYDCCEYAFDEQVDDVGFVAALLDELVATQQVDPARVYVVGFSNGAMMTYRLACELSDRVAAVGVLAGALNSDACAPTRPVPVVVLHGTEDGSVPYEGGTSDDRTSGQRDRVDRPVSYAVEFWAEHDGCPATPSSEQQGAVVVTTYAPCEAGSEVVLYTIEGGGHAWPGGDPGRRGADEPAPEPDASTVVLDFFDRFTVS